MLSDGLGGRGLDDARQGEYLGMLSLVVGDKNNVTLLSSCGGVTRGTKKAEEDPEYGYAMGAANAFVRYFNVPLCEMRAFAC